MPAISEERLRRLLAPFTVVDAVAQEIPEVVWQQLLVFLELLMRWNERTNLTAIRDAETVVERHLGESLFAGLLLRRHVAPGVEVLDFGSGAGLPGIPVQLVLPEVVVTLAESQGKKAAFLREAVRVLGIPARVWAGRVEAMPVGRRFDVVTMRAVDRMETMRAVGLSRLRADGTLMEMVAARSDTGVEVSIPTRRDSLVRLTRPGDWSAVAGV